MVIYLSTTMSELFSSRKPSGYTYEGLGTVDDIRSHVSKILSRGHSGLLHAMEGHLGVVESMQHYISNHNSGNFTVDIENDDEEPGFIYQKFKVNLSLNDFEICVPLATQFALEMYYHRDLKAHHDIVDEVYTKFGHLALLPILAAAGFPYPYDQNGETLKLLSKYPEGGYFRGIERPRGWWEIISTHSAGVEASILEKNTYSNARNLYNAMCRSHKIYPQASEGFWTASTESVMIQKAHFTMIIPSNESREQASFNYKSKGHNLPPPSPKNASIITAWLNVKSLPPYATTWRENEQGLRLPHLTGATLEEVQNWA